MNSMRAQLDRRLAQRGETIWLRRTVGTLNQSFVQCEMPAIVRALTVEQLVGNITQQSLFLITSPTEIYRQQWPGGRAPEETGDIIDPKDVRIPLRTDWVFVRGLQKAIQRVAPIFDRGECIRIEMTVIG